ncbi:hypothetical protein PR002_g30228 [Phytophthora rubi]|uniref:Uncharacterized protein n=1 Tax=Phytophthora rubi TaxID=129364 RepID=A0A6A3GU10_9STRA|nr:hypothetical protein PR002_g30228 [Phytophthora rubi]
MDTWSRGTDENFITTTSLSRSAFCMLLERFAPFYEIPSRRPKVHMGVLGRQELSGPAAPEPGCAKRTLQRMAPQRFRHRDIVF